MRVEEGRESKEKIKKKKRGGEARKKLEKGSEGNEIKRKEEEEGRWGKEGKGMKDRGIRTYW